MKIKKMMTLLAMVSVGSSLLVQAETPASAPAAPAVSAAPVAPVAKKLTTAEIAKQVADDNAAADKVKADAIAAAATRKDNAKKKEEEALKAWENLTSTEMQAKYKDNKKSYFVNASVDPIDVTLNDAEKPFTVKPGESVSMVRAQNQKYKIKDKNDKCTKEFNLGLGNKGNEASVLHLGDSCEEYSNNTFAAKVVDASKKAIEQAKTDKEAEEKAADADITAAQEAYEKTKDAIAARNKEANAAIKAIEEKTAADAKAAQEAAKAAADAQKAEEERKAAEEAKNKATQEAIAQAVQQGISAAEKKRADEAAALAAEAALIQEPAFLEKKMRKEDEVGRDLSPEELKQVIEDYKKEKNTPQAVF